MPLGSSDPAEVSAETGLVKYQLVGPLEDRPPAGASGRRRDAHLRLLLVQVLSDGRLKVECCQDKSAAAGQRFTSAALIYER